MNKHFAGIDPGLTGAIAVINNHAQIIQVDDYSAEPRKLFNIYQRLSKLDLTVCIENIMFMSQQSFKNQFKYIATFFIQVFLLELFGIEYKIVDSRAWKKEFKITKDKKESFNLAKDIFDNSASVLLSVSKHHNRAEALLLAEYGRRILFDK